MAAGVSGFNAYSQDASAMNSAGFTDYAAFIKAIYSQIQKTRRPEPMDSRLLQPGR